MDHRFGLSGIGDGSAARSRSSLDLHQIPGPRSEGSDRHTPVAMNSENADSQGISVALHRFEGSISGQGLINFRNLKTLSKCSANTIDCNALKARIKKLGIRDNVPIWVSFPLPSIETVPLQSMGEIHAERSELFRGLTNFSTNVKVPVKFDYFPGAVITVNPGETDIEYKYVLKNGEPIFSEPQEEKQSRWPIGKNKSSDQETSKIVAVTENKRGAFCDCSPDDFKSCPKLDNHLLFALGSRNALDKKCLPEERVVEIAQSMTSGKPEARINVVVTKQIRDYFQKKYGDAGTERLENHCRYIEELANNSIKRSR